jgi:radical SAM-linked protein
MIANALSLGATSHGEIVDFELTQNIDVERFKEQLASQLPPDIPVYRVEEVGLKAPAATQLLERAEYLITVARVEDVAPCPPNPPIVGGTNTQQWQDWVEQVKSSEEIWWEQTTKSGKKKQVNLRDRLFELEVQEPQSSEEQREDSPIVLRYVGSCRNDGTLLRPEHIVFMLEQVAGLEFQLLHAHRQQLILGSIH